MKHHSAWAIMETSSQESSHRSPATGVGNTSPKRGRVGATNLESVGSTAKRIEVSLSYRIVELFSEGLYTSANKAFEELVTNSFDAGASKVNILLPADRTADDATIAVVDEGRGMDINGLAELWQIGASNKRGLTDLPRGRPQIGKFGIGKLATYVLANKLTYICKTASKYYAVTMDYTKLDAAAEKQLLTKKPVFLNIRQLSSDQANDLLKPWTDQAAFKPWPVRLFGQKSKKSWTFAIMSSLKDKANEIEDGRLEWLLRTALPLRDDFAIYLNGKKLTADASRKGRLDRWVIGRDITTLQKPAPSGITVRTDKNLADTEDGHFGISHPQLGRMTGYAEAYRDVLTTGKAADLGRSYGFFVYVRGRLINVDDEYFGIDSNLLRHGTFARFRLVINIERLDEELRSSREGVRDGPRRTLARDLLHAIFNFVRPKIEEATLQESASARLARRLAESPASLSQRPLVELVRLTLSGKATPRLLLVPHVPQQNHERFVDSFEARLRNPSEFIRSVEFSYELGGEAALAAYDTVSGALKINALHPFVGAFADDYQSLDRSLPLDLLALAEVLLEAQLYQFAVKPSEIEAVLRERDELLRYLARSSGRRSSLTVSQDLRNARNDKNKLEDELVAAFDKLGFEAVRIGGTGKPDGRAIAHLSADDKGKPKRYAVSLEAKSKEKDGRKVTAKSVNISGVVRHRDDFECNHAVVVGPDFPTSEKEKSALQSEISADGERFKDLVRDDKKTVTLIKIDDLARLVRIAPLKQVGPSRLRELFQNCAIPEEARRWIDELAAGTTPKQPYKELLEEVWAEQKTENSAAVDYSVLRVRLRGRQPSIVKTNAELIELCKALAAMAPGLVAARSGSVEIEVPPAKILSAIKAAVHDYPESDKPLIRLS